MEQLLPELQIATRDQFVMHRVPLGGLHRDILDLGDTVEVPIPCIPHESIIGYSNYLVESEKGEKQTFFGVEINLARVENYATDVIASGHSNYHIVVDVSAETMQEIANRIFPTEDNQYYNFHEINLAQILLQNPGDVLDIILEDRDIGVVPVIGGWTANADFVRKLNFINDIHKRINRYGKRDYAVVTTDARGWGGSNLAPKAQIAVSEACAHMLNDRGYVPSPYMPGGKIHSAFTMYNLLYSKMLGPKLIIPHSTAVGDIRHTLEFFTWDELAETTVINLAGADLDTNQLGSRLSPRNLLMDSLKILYQLTAAQSDEENISYAFQAIKNIGKYAGILPETGVLLNPQKQKLVDQMIGQIIAALSLNKNYGADINTFLKSVHSYEVMTKTALTLAQARVWASRAIPNSTVHANGINGNIHYVNQASVLSNLGIPTYINDDDTFIQPIKYYSGSNPLNIPAQYMMRNIYVFTNDKLVPINHTLPLVKDVEGVEIINLSMDPAFDGHYAPCVFFINIPGVADALDGFAQQLEMSRYTVKQLQANDINRIRHKAADLKKTGTLQHSAFLRSQHRDRKFRP